MPNLIKTINLTDGDKATLESILHQGTVEARTYIRAKILLLKSEGRSNESIADKLDICVTAVRLCIDKYNTGGIKAALQDNKGRGRKAEITDTDITWVINKITTLPIPQGRLRNTLIQYPEGLNLYLRQPMVPG